MGLLDASGDLSSEIEVDAFRCLFPLRFYERHLAESIWPDGSPLGRARETSIAPGAVASADGSALAKIGSTVTVDFHMPPICSPIVRPGRPAEAAPVFSKQLSDTISSSGMINLKELSLVSGKAAWMAYLDIYCLDADGALFDAALLSAIAAFSHLQIPAVSLNDDDPTAEEETIMETVVTVVLDSSSQLISLYKPGGAVLASTSAVQDCIALTRQRVRELLKILDEANSSMEVD
ncbi:Exosome complex component RRP43 [Morella rubra]|uniref:Ribosomal RNA-processing protein 43 n=1 Tax=Morella rubra TaxID=262757 RepID=A0A6A1WAT2_9ROSI|nr:Exosome complex component RRP43 [Morella rubra]